MSPEFITYQKFDDVALANILAETLNQHGIENYIQEETTGFDPSMVMSHATVDYSVKIRSENFEVANRILRENEEKNINETEEDYYLFSFTDDELRDVVVKADEWNMHDVVLAKKILADRGILISEKELVDINEKRIQELKEVKPLSKFHVALGYIFSFAFVGLPYGWYLATGKKTLPNGEKIYAYSENDRKHGKVIFCISITCFILAVIYKFYLTY